MQQLVDHFGLNCETDHVDRFNIQMSDPLSSDEIDVHGTDESNVVMYVGYASN
jgi:hypothetical protein